MDDSDEGDVGECIIGVHRALARTTACTHASCRRAFRHRFSYVTVVAFAEFLRIVFQSYFIVEIHLSSHYVRYPCDKINSRNYGYSSNKHGVIFYNVSGMRAFFCI
jgi:hypothetical protein